jgi:hypothetical protein
MIKELIRPWKLFSFAVGMAWLIHCAVTYDFQDWDVGISVLMGTLTYIFAPWSVREIFISIRDRPKNWQLRIIVALGVAWVVVDGSYVIYNSLRHHAMLRYDNFLVSSSFYFLAGILWAYRGSLRDLARDLRVIR